jgi:LytS/YehU family sensor histidine kinase
MRRIIVRAALEGNVLVLSVEDNGSGMAAATRERLLHPQAIDHSSLSRVMGLENVIQQLYFFYPDDPGIVDIVTGKGTTIIIRIDTRREPCIKF